MIKEGGKILRVTRQEHQFIMRILSIFRDEKDVRLVITKNKNNPRGIIIEKMDREYIRFF